MEMSCQIAALPVRKEPPRTDSIDSLNTLKKSKIKPHIIQPIAYHITDYAIVAPTLFLCVIKIYLLDTI
jgi:hypothetical protein